MKNNTDIRIAIVSAAGIMAADRERKYVSEAISTFEEVINAENKYNDVQIIDSAMAYLHRAVSIQRLPNEKHEPVSCWLGAIGISSDFDIFATTAIYIALKTNPGIVSKMQSANSVVIFPCREEDTFLVAVMPCFDEEEYNQVVKLASTAMGKNTIH